VWATDAGRYDALHGDDAVLRQPHDAVLQRPGCLGYHGRGEEQLLAEHRKMYETVVEEGLVLNSIVDASWSAGLTADSLYRSSKSAQ
jgi:hypothetical protein